MNDIGLRKIREHDSNVNRLFEKLCSKKILNLEIGQQRNIKSLPCFKGERRVLFEKKSKTCFRLEGGYIFKKEKFQMTLCSILPSCRLHNDIVRCPVF